MSETRKPKIYGAVETESYITFTGFCKKIHSNEQQKVNVFIDGKKIDVISANQTLKEIEHKYEVFDTNGLCFKYRIPTEFIGKKHKLEFMTDDGENLLQSPFFTLDSSHEKYNEYRFLESLKEKIDEEKIKDVYCPNSIGFLATEENLNDKEFVVYINQIMKDFSNCKFKALVFNDNLNSKITNLFSLENLEIIKISNIYEVFQNIEVYLSNYERAFNNNYENRIIQFIRSHSIDIFGVGMGLQRKNISTYQLEINNPSYFQKFFDNLEYLGFNNNDITKYGKTYHEIYFKKACEKYGVDVEFDINETVSKAYVYWNLKLGLANHEFFKNALEFARKFGKL